MRAAVAETYSMKFDRPFTAWLWDQTMDGGTDEEWGSSQFCGWFAMMGRHVITEETSGAVYSWHWTDSYLNATAEKFYAWLREYVGAETFDAYYDDEHDIY